MADQKPITPKKFEQTPQQQENIPLRKESFETLAKQAEAESKIEEDLIQQLNDLKTKIAAAPKTTAVIKQQGRLAADIEAKKERIISKLVNAACAADFSSEAMKRIMNIAEKYIKKDYPDIADEIHDRIINEMNKTN